MEGRRAWLVLCVLGVSIGLPLHPPDVGNGEGHDGLGEVAASLHRIMGGGFRDYVPGGWPETGDFVKAAGWEGGVSARTPVVFIPPFSGVRLLQKIDNKPVHSPADLLCPRSSHGQWTPAWLPGTTGKIDIFCTIRNMAFGGRDAPQQEGRAGTARLTMQRKGRIGESVPRGPVLTEGAEATAADSSVSSDSEWYPAQEGVVSTFDDTFNATLYLDASGQAAPIFGPWVKAMTKAGWKAGVDIDALRYDWRKGPDSYMAPGGAFDMLKQMIENMVTATGKKVAVVSFSMGSPMFSLFCNTHVSPTWQSKHLANFVSLSGSFGGAASPLFSLLTGRWGKLIPHPLQGLVMSLARSMGSPPWMVPAVGVYGADKVAVQTPQRTYTLSQLGDALRDAGATRASDFWTKFQGQTGPWLTPNVTTHCLYGVSVPTPDVIIVSKALTASGSSGVSASFTWGDGDGTVLLPGLTACGGGGGSDAARLHPFVNVSHSDILKSLDAWSVVARLISSPAKP